MKQGRITMPAASLIESAARGSGGPDTPLSLEDAARRLGVEVAAVRRFVHQRLLRLVPPESSGVWRSDVERLARVLARHSGAGLS
jgi:hypothetical protein